MLGRMLLPAAGALLLCYLVSKPLFFAIVLGGVALIVLGKDAQAPARGQPTLVLARALLPAGGALLLCYLVAKPAFFVIALSGIALAVLYACIDHGPRRQLGVAPARAAVLMPVAAWLLPHISLLFVATILIVPLLARRAGQVAPLYLFALMLLPGLDIDLMIGSLKLSHFGVHDGLALGAAATLFFHRGRRARVPMRFDLPFLCLMLVFVWAFSRGTSFTNALRVGLDLWFDCALPYYIVSRGVRSIDDVRCCMLHLAAAAAVLSVILVFEAVRAWPIYNVLYDHYDNPARLIVKTRGGLMRAGGPFLEPTSVAMVLVFCFLAAWMSRAAFRSRLHYYGVLALLLAGLLVPQSRGAWIGLFTGLAMADLYAGRLRTTALRAAAIASAGLCLFAVAQGNPALSESLGLSGGSTDTVHYREQLFTRGMEELRDSPLFGFSYPELLVRLDDLRQGEGIIDPVNAHLFVALIAGAIGFLVFNGTFLAYLAQLWRGRRATGRGDRPALAFAFACLVTPMQMLVFTSFGGRVQAMLFVFFGLAAAIGAVLARSGARGVQVAKTGSSSPLTAMPATMPAIPAASSRSSSPAWNSPMR